MIKNKNISPKIKLFIVFFQIISNINLIYACLPPAGQCCSTPTCTNAPPCQSTSSMHSGSYSAPYSKDHGGSYGGKYSSSGNEYTNSYNMDSSHESSGGYDKSSYKKSKYSGGKKGYNSYGGDNNYESSGYADSYNSKIPPPSYSSYGGTSPYSPPPNYSYQPPAPSYSTAPAYPSPLPPPTYPSLAPPPPTYSSPLPPPPVYQSLPSLPTSPQIYQTQQQTSPPAYPLPPMPSTIVYPSSPLSLPSTSSTTSNMFPQLALPSEYPQIIGNKIVGTTPSLYQGLYQPLNGKGGGLISNGGLAESIGSFDSTSLLSLPPSVSPSQDFFSGSQYLNPSITSYPPNGPFIINLASGGGLQPSGYNKSTKKKIVLLNKVKEKNSVAAAKTLKKEAKSFKDLAINKKQVAKTI